MRPNLFPPRHMNEDEVRMALDLATLATTIALVGVGMCKTCIESVGRILVVSPSTPKEAEALLASEARILAEHHNKHHIKGEPGEIQSDRTSTSQAN